MATIDLGPQTGEPARPAGSSIVPQGPARLVLIAVTIAVLMQLLRSAVPQFDRLAETAGPATALAALVPIALAGLLAVPIRRIAGPRGLLLVGAGGLLLIRLVTQLIGPQLATAVLGAAVGMIALAALYEGARGLSGVGFATAVTAGLAVDTSVRMMFATWDPVWRSGITEWAVCLLIVVLGAVALWRELSSGPVPAPGISWREAIGAAALGPFLTLQLLALSSPAFVASSGWQSLLVAHLVVATGQGLALAFLASGLAVRAVPGGVCILGGTLLGVGTGAIVGAYALTGYVVVGIVIVCQLLAAWLLAVACRAPLRRSGDGGSIRRVDVGAALGGSLIVVLLVPYLLSTAGPLPMPGNVFPALAGMLLGGLAAVTAAHGGPLPARAPLRALVGGAAGLMLLIGTAVFAFTDPDVRHPAPGPRLRVMTYNIHQSVDLDGKVDPESIARRIEEQQADVVLLQEVSRGSLTAGNTDVGVWLSRRLGMHLIWGPAGDGQTGNAILTSRPVRRSGSARLPKGDWSQLRGYVWARLVVGDRTVDVWSTHLEGGAGRRRERMREIGALLRAWGGAPRTIVGGDFNAEPGSDELLRFTEGTGLRPASMSDTEPTTPGGRKLDWILGTDDMVFAELAVRPSTGFDHYPYAVTVRIG